jgi:hypothetical protein
VLIDCRTRKFTIGVDILLWRIFVDIELIKNFLIKSMDRGKNLPAKASKSKPLGFPGDFIALGSKSGRPAESSDVKVKNAVSSSAATAVKSSSSTLPSSSGLYTISEICMIAYLCPEILDFMQALVIGSEKTRLVQWL